MADISFLDHAASSNIFSSSLLAEPPESNVSLSPVSTLPQISSAFSHSSKQLWPLDYRLPSVFPDNVVLALEHKLNLNKPRERYIRGQFLQAIVCNAMRKYTLYPDRAEKTDMARAIIREYPHLRDQSRSGYATWYQSITDSLKNARRPLKHIQEVASRSRKRKFVISQTPTINDFPSMTLPPDSLPTAVSHSQVSVDSVSVISSANHFPTVDEATLQLLVNDTTNSGVVSHVDACPAVVLQSVATEQIIVPELLLSAQDSMAAVTAAATVTDQSSGTVSETSDVAHSSLDQSNLSANHQTTVTVHWPAPSVTQFTQPELQNLIQVPVTTGHVSRKRKVPQDAVLNFAPDVAKCLDSEQLQTKLQEIADIMQLDDSHRDGGRLAALMEATFINRRQLINSKTSIRDVRSEYPALFTTEGILRDYMSMVQQPLTCHTMPTFRKQLCLTAGSLMRLTDKSDGKPKSRTAKQLQCKLGVHTCHCSYSWWLFVLLIKLLMLFICITYISKFYFTGNISELYRVAPKIAQFFVHLNSSTINRFSKLFHCQNQEKICNNTISKDPTTPQVCRYTTL